MFCEYVDGIDIFVKYVEKRSKNRYMQYHYPNQKVIYKGKRVDLLTVETGLEGGKVAKREVVNHPGAVVILPLLDEKTVLLIRNERFVVQQILWELPAGTLEENEEPLECARRELVEETGYRAEKVTPLLDFFSTPGFCNERLFGYLAKDLHFVGQKLDESEKIDVEAVALVRALEMIKEGVICDAKTICLLLYFAQWK